MKACRDYDVLVSLHAAGALAPDEAARLDGHLAACPACRADLARSAAALRLARLPEPTRAERRLLADLPDRMIEEVRRTDQRRGVARRLAIGGAVAAAFAIALLAPIRLHDRTAAPEVATAAADVWQEPDLDAIWQETELVDFAADTGDDPGAAYAVPASATYANAN